MIERARCLLWTSILLSSACASVPPAHVDPARDPANPRAREAALVVAGELPADDPTLKVGKPPFETGESGTKEGSSGGHHHGGAAAPAEKPAEPMDHKSHQMPAPSTSKKPPSDHPDHDMKDMKDMKMEKP